MNKLIFTALLFMGYVGSVFSADWQGEKSKWHDCDRYDFKIADRNATVVVPENPLPGNPWVWRPAFFDAFPIIDEALLKKGFHITYFDTTDEWGRPTAIKAGKEFYDYAISQGLMEKTILEGLSRGGYYSLCYAEKYPETVAALLLDNPLVDLTELMRFDDWGSDVVGKWRQDVNREPGYQDNACNNITPLAKNKIPVMLLSGGADDIVPFQRHGKIIKDVYKRWNAPIKSVVRPNSGHHPHGIDNPVPIVDYLYDCIYDKSGNNIIKLACLGDSMTEGVGTDDFSRQSYPAVLQQLLGDKYRVGNFGVSCATMLKEGVDAEKPFGYSGLPAMQRAIDWNPDIVIISLGVNDVKNYNWEAHGAEFTDDYQDFINQLRLLPSLPEIYLVLEPYVNLNADTRSWGFDDKGYYEEMIEGVIKVAEANGLPLIDLRDVFTGERIDCYAPNHHPNPRGAAMMAKEIVRQM